MRSMTFCATVLSLTIATAVASAQTPSPSAAAPVASPADKQAISKACSDQANAKGLHGKVRKEIPVRMQKEGWRTAVTEPAIQYLWQALCLDPPVSLLGAADEVIG